MSGSRGDSDKGWRPDPIPVTPKTKGGGGGGNGGTPDPCNISERTNLNSVDRTMLASLRAGHILSVIYQAGPPRRLVAQTAVGETVGSITSPSMAQIIQCIQSGVAFEAEVLSIRGALCQVEVRRA